MKNKSNKSRKIALLLLEEILIKEVHTYIAVNKSNPILNKLDKNDKKFTFNLLMTVIRRLGHIDLIINKFIDKPIKKNNIIVKNILRIGIAQIIFLNTPDHAAVNQSVELAEGDLIRYKSLINAILRKVVSNKKLVDKVISNPLKNLPGSLSEKWINVYGIESTKAIAKIFMQQAPIDISAKKNPEIISKKIGGLLLPNKSIRLKKNIQITEEKTFNEGKWWVQNAAAAVPANLLINSINNLKLNNDVIDICAAPGGKTAQLCSAGLNVTAVDKSNERINLLKGNLKRLKLSANILRVDATKLSFKKSFSGVLLDAPCTGTGTIGRRPDIAWHKNLQLISKLNSIQETMLLRSSEILVKGGVLVYSVCSLEKEEGINLVKKIKKSYNLSILEIASNEVPGLENSITSEGFIQTLPYFWKDIGGIDGFFIARFIKN